MNVIKVKVNIDIDNEQQVKSFNSFIAELKKAGGNTAVVEAPVKDIKVATAPAATAPAATAAAAPAAAAAPTPAASTGSKKLDAIRALIAQKAGEHREAMKAKLVEFGAATATDLTVDKYDAFHTFLENL
jgi:pyruvate/2-oxoglutarate dehydrogenase complex dihydrolipoamide acyltransferase (E2) component